MNNSILKFGDTKHISFVRSASISEEGIECTGIKTKWEREVLRGITGIEFDWCVIGEGKLYPDGTFQPEGGERGFGWDLFLDGAPKAEKDKEDGWIYFAPWESIIFYRENQH